MPRLWPHAFLVALCVGLASPSLADSGKSRYCGTGYWFELEEPEGWQTDWNANGEMLALELRPVDAASNPPPAIGLKLMLSGSSHRRDVVVDPEEALNRWLGLLNALASPAEIDSFEVSGLELPSAGALMRFEQGSAYVVALDVQSGRGNYFLATLGKTGGEATAAELATFRALLASIDFDPRRSCDGDGKGGTVEKTLPGPNPAAQGPAVKEPHAFELEKAGAGCAVLYELFIPIYCEMAELDGKPALLAFFDDDDGTESAATYLERFRERVAVPFCYEAKRHPSGAPQLVFHAENSPEAHVYGCEAQRPERSVPIGSIVRTR